MPRKQMPRFFQDRANANVIRLSIAQALGGANSAIIYSTGAIVGEMFSPSKNLATLPISIFVVGMALCTLPAGVIAQRYGRRNAFLVGTLAGVLTGLLAAVAVYFASFAIFCLSMLFGGAYNAVVLSFRFAAADGVDPEMRPRAVSAVMAGGVLAGLIGPQAVIATMDLWQPYLFFVTYLVQAALAAVSMLVLAGIRVPAPARVDRTTGRPLNQIASQPRFITAVVCGVVSYMMMNFVMTSAPLAMKLCGLPLASANLGIQWHVIAMYGPSFITGRLIGRFGAPAVVAMGLALIAGAAATGLAGIDVGHFWLALILLGVGWNFGFVGASTLILECHGSEEKANVQSLNDFVVFGAMVIGSFASGNLLTSYGWKAVCLVTLPPLTVAGAMLGWSSLSSRRARMSETPKGI